MADTNFINSVTLTDAEWFNDLNDAFYTAFGGVAGAGTITKVQFPATAVPSADANALDDYQESQTTFTLTGCTTSPTYVGKWTKVGNKVTVSFPGTSIVSGTSNAITKTLTGMPAELFPSGDIYAAAFAADNGGALAAAGLRIASTGVITLYPATIGTAWTNSGAATFYLPEMSWTTA